MSLLGRMRASLSFVLRDDPSAVLKARAITQVMPTWELSQPVYPVRSYTNMVTQGYRKNELIFACIEKTAKTPRQLSLQVKSLEGKDLPNHSVQRLLQRPNPHMSESFFWASVVIYQKLAGRAFYEKERNNGGQTIALWPLRPDWVQVVPSRTAMIGGYQYAPPGMQPVSLRAEDVLDFPLFDPMDQYRAYPPVAVAARVGDVDNSTTDFLKLLFEKGGVPPGYLKTTQKLLNDAAADHIRKRWSQKYGGWENWAEPAVLDSDADWKKAGLSIEEMGFEILDARNETRICMVLDVPPILVGTKVGLDRSTYSNYEEARRAWWEDSLMPLYTDLASVFYSSLVDELTGTELEWDVSRVVALQEKNQQLWTRANDALRAGGITVNEYRELVDLQPVDTGDVFLRPITATEVPVNRDDSQPAEEEPLDEQDDEQGAEAETDTASLSPGHQSEKRAAPSDRARRVALEEDMLRELHGYFRQQYTAMLEELRRTYGT